MIGLLQRRAVRAVSGCACVAALAAGALSGCGSDASSASPASASAAATGTPGKAYKVAVLSVGTKTDGAFGQAWSQASSAAGKKTGAKVQWVGNLDAPNQYLAQGSSYAGAGYDLVVLAHGGMLPVGVQLAKRFPKTQFCVTPIPTAPTEAVPANLCVVDAKQEVGAFRSGMLAGLVTKTDVVASNQSLPIPAITRQVEAFRLGAECVNAKVKVLNVVTNNDTDPSVTSSAAQAQLREHADVLMGATGTAMAGMFEAAKQRPGTYAIGQYVDSTDVAPSAVLASNIVNFQAILPLIVEAAEKGPLPPFTAYGLGSPVPVGYLAMNQTLYGRLPVRVRAANDRAQAELTAGKITIPATADLVAPGAAAKVDVASLGCHPAR